MEGKELGSTDTGIMQTPLHMHNPGLVGLPHLDMYQAWCVPPIHSIPQCSDVLSLVHGAVSKVYIAHAE